MTFLDGFMMFLFSMAAFFTLAMVAWFIIQEVVGDRKKEKMDLEKDRE
jgi:p-aminobenzoyl-glutamate transporter AbgT